ncbi:hypothetical protein ACJX0J_017219 [Zea mays]
MHPAIFQAVNNAPHYEPSPDLNENLVILEEGSFFMVKIFNHLRMLRRHQRLKILSNLGHFQEAQYTLQICLSLFYGDIGRKWLFLNWLESFQMDDNVNYLLNAFKSNKFYMLTLPKGFSILLFLDTQEELCDLSL